MPKLLYNASNIYSDTMRMLDLLKDIRRAKINIEGLETLETELKKKILNQNSWVLKSKLTFKNINKTDLNIPAEIEKNVAEIILELKVNISEMSCFERDIKDTIIQNNDVKYGIQLITFGKTLPKKSNYKMSWHLDKHIRSVQPDGEGKGFIHPEYHFNMGGFALTKEVNFNFGSVLLIDTPRIIHPPLDLVLSIDFVLKNFYGIRVKNLTESKQYKTIVYNAKRRLWRPYFISIANFWESQRFSHLDIETDYANKILGYS